MTMKAKVQVHYSSDKPTAVHDSLAEEEVKDFLSEELDRLYYFEDVEEICIQFTKAVDNV